PMAAAIVPGTLWSAANDLYFVQNIRLKGIHGLMFVDEVALVSVPDAIQLGWTPDVAPVLSPPVAAPVTPSQRAGFADCIVPPVVLSVDPTGGPLVQTAAQRTTVTIVGTGFASAGPVSVAFGGLAADAVQVNDGATLTCLAPQAAAPGPVTVTVSNSAGTGS